MTKSHFITDRMSFYLFNFFLYLSQDQRQGAPFAANDDHHTWQRFCNVIGADLARQPRFPCVLKECPRAIISHPAAHWASLADHAAAATNVALTSDSTIQAVAQCNHRVAEAGAFILWEGSDHTTKVLQRANMLNHGAAGAACVE